MNTHAASHHGQSHADPDNLVPTNVNPDLDASRLEPLATTDLVSIVRWGGWSGLAATVAFIVTILATSLLGSPEAYDGPDDIVRYLDEVSDNSVRSYVYGIAGIVMSILFMPFAVSVYLLLRRRALAVFGSLAMVVGLAMLIPAYAVAILEAAALGPAATDVGANGIGALYAVEEAAVAIQVVFFTVGSVLTLSLAPLLWAIEGRRTGTVPTWINPFGLATALTGLVWFVWFFETPVLLVGLLLNVVASLVYFVALSRHLATWRP